MVLKGPRTRLIAHSKLQEPIGDRTGSRPQHFIHHGRPQTSYGLIESLKVYTAVASRNGVIDDLIVFVTSRTHSGMASREDK